MTRSIAIVLILLMLVGMLSCQAASPVYVKYGSGEVEIKYIQNSKVITVQDISLSTGIMDRNAVDFTNKGKVIKAGEPCLLVKGIMTNGSQADLLVDFFADGYNEKGERVSRTLDASMTMGRAQIELPTRSSHEFLLHLNLSEEIRLIKITTQPRSLSSLFPTQPDTPPDTDLVRIIFSLEWINENDMDPDPYTVKITFPALWLTESPTLSPGETPIELRLPKRLLMDNNISHDPELITVTFPNDYFTGLPSPPIPSAPGITPLH